MSSSELLIQWYDQVWNNANAEFIDQWMHKDVIVHGLDPTGTSKGINEFKLFYYNFRSSFPTVNVDVQPLVSNNEFATGYCVVHAVNINGKEVLFSGLSVVKFKDDKAIECWNNFDFLKMYQQLGHILQSTIEE